MKASRKYTGQGPCFAQGRSRLRPTTRWLRIVSSAGLAAVLAACSVAGVPSTGKVQRAEGAISFNDAARFLDQATFGATLADIQHLQDIGYSAWIDEQFAMGISNYPNVCCSGSVVTCSPVIPCEPGDVEAYPNNAPANCGATFGDRTCHRDNYTMWKLQNIFYQNALGAPDQLRQRIFFALNQILVTSGQDAMINRTHQMSPYLRVLEQNAFGNFRDILHDISLNGAMGRYLDNIDNTASQRNENYARELMQLFSVGLFILNDDGTPTGVPTYDQDGVVELTRALSGWQLAAQFSAGVPNYKDPLRPKAAAQHDSDSKTLFVNTPYAQTIPAGGTAPTDLEASIDIIFNHPNVGPFIGKALIQMLVTSNPSGDYVRRVTQAFNAKPRGDMQRVVRAILLDAEARDSNPGPNFGKLKEPVLQMTNLMRALRGSFNTDYGLSDFSLVGLNGSFNTAYLARGEDVFRSPTVFNFFPPDFSLPGDTTGLLGPEFGILSTTTALGAINLTYRLVVSDLPQVLTPYPYRPTGTQFDPTTIDGSDPNALVENLNQVLLHGSMADDLRTLVVNQVSGVADVNQRVRQAVFLIASSPAYQVQR